MKCFIPEISNSSMFWFPISIGESAKHIVIICFVKIVSDFFQSGGDFSSLDEDLFLPSIFHSPCLCRHEYIRTIYKCVLFVYLVCAYCKLITINFVFNREGFCAVSFNRPMVFLVLYMLSFSPEDENASVFCTWRANSRIM